MTFVNGINKTCELKKRKLFLFQNGIFLKFCTKFEGAFGAMPKNKQMSIIFAIVLKSLESGYGPGIKASVRDKMSSFPGLTGPIIMCSDFTAEELRIRR